tara:strand:+ start:446 stop:1852 length:1407 start_codon:yes stop_codon:yes gene_type:complete
MSEFEEDTQDIFINTEQNFGNSGGDQVNKFRLNFNQEPFESGDEAILRIALTQFNMDKNMYDVNSTNNTFRICSSAIVASGTNLQAVAGDKFVSIPAADYVSPDILSDTLAQTIKDYLNEVITVGSVTFEMSAGNTAAGVSTGLIDVCQQFGIDSTGAGTLDGRQTPSSILGGNFTTIYNKIQRRKYSIYFTLLDGAGNAATNFEAFNLVIQCLNIPPGQERITLSGIDATDNQQFNDSYALLGGVRIEEFQANPSALPDAERRQSFSIQKDTTGTNNHFVVTTAYPMAQGANTLPYIYLRCEAAENQSSRSIEDAARSHDHEIIPSRILAKIPRTINARQSISYTLENVGGLPFFTNITANYVNHLIFSITDHRGRVIQPVSVNDLPPSAVQRISSGVAIADVINPNFAAQAGTQNTVGNLYCDFAFKISKHRRKVQSNILQSTQPAIITNNRMEFSGVIPNSVYQH